MKYKVGDKVKVRSDLKCEEYYGGVPFTSEMNRFKGMEFTIARVNNGGYYKVLETPYSFANEMLEPVEEMSAEEAIKLSGKLCSSSNCNECPVFKARKKYGERCNVFEKEHAEEYLEILKQWKADHEKKPIETKWVWYVKIIEADTHLLKHEELLELDFSIPMDRKKEEILKKYCAEHDGKYYVTDERRCVVKE